MIKQYDKVKLKSGKTAIIVEVLKEQEAYIADIEVEKGDYETEEIRYSDIVVRIVEVEEPLSARYVLVVIIKRNKGLSCVQ
ncbi:MAG: hypothetical protein LBR68_00900 [Lachnoclostridium sp.]|nr:hypothetical protein [Lachnoclostridium sp.]